MKAFQICRRSSVGRACSWYEQGHRFNPDRRLATQDLKNTNYFVFVRD